MKTIFPGGGGGTGGWGERGLSSMLERWMDESEMVRFESVARSLAN